MAFDPAAEASQDIVGPKFLIVTKALAGGVDPSGKRRFKATASSTIVDRKGDEIQLPALQKMAEQFRQGVTIFMDHDRSTGSAYGLSDGAEIVQRGLDESGVPVWDLDITGVVNTPNPRAVQLADSIDGGFVKLGASVTAFVRKHLRNKVGGMSISDVDVIEASIVGVPENQRSWATKAALAVKSFYKNEEDEPVDQPETPVDTAGNEVPDDAGAEPVAVTSDPEVEKSLDPSIGAPTVDATVASTPDVQASAEESDDTSETPSGETPASTSDEDADPPIAEKAYEPGDVAELVGHVSNLVSRIGAQEALLIEKDAKIAELETKVARYEVEAGTITKEVDAAKEVIEKVLHMPLRSQTAGFVDQGLPPGSLFARVSPDIADYLNKRSKINGN
jgi:hypothetical protein